MWLLPSRGRPGNLARFFNAYRQTGGSTPGMVIVDTDDYLAHRPAYSELALPMGWLLKITSGVTQGEKIAEVWHQVKDCAWLGLIGDDCVPETMGWDRRLTEALDGTNFVSCDDGWQAPKRVGNCWVMSGDLVRAVGWIFPPGLQHLYVDDVWEEIGHEAGCWRVLMDVKVAHRHVLKGEAAPDDTHRAVYGSDGSDPQAGMWPLDAAAYTGWQKSGKADTIAAVRALNPGRNAADADEEQKVQARMARAKSRFVLIASPVHRGFEEPFVTSIIQTVILLERLGVRQDCQWVKGGSNLPKSRNQLAAGFLAGDWTDLIFIDTDMGWDPNAVVRLLASDKDVIAAVGRRKCEEVSWCCNLPAGPLRQDDMGALEVPRAGTGLMKITRDALEQIIAARPDLKGPGDDNMSPGERANYHHFFRFGDDDSGEDYVFCDLFRSVGGEVWIDPEIWLSHTGEKAYAGKFADALKPVVTVIQDKAA